jgi:7-cyano-7-deazaguanine synthase
VAVPDLDAIRREQRDQPPTYVPNRNMVLLSLAAAYAETVGAETVFYGAQAQDEIGYWDCTLEFVERLNAVLSLNRGRKITVRAPFADMRKSDVLRLGLELGVDYARTWTCYRGAEKACGTCPSCVERSKAFETVGVPDPLSCET